MIIDVKFVGRWVIYVLGEKIYIVVFGKGFVMDDGSLMGKFFMIICCLWMIVDFLIF